MREDLENAKKNGNQQAFKQLDADIRAATAREQEVKERQGEINKLLSKIEKEDEAFNKKFDDAMAAEEENRLNGLVDKLDTLEAEKADLATKEADADAARTLYEEFNPEDEANRPAAWTEALAEQYAEDYYDK